jgi:hypothetical protein
MRTLIRALVWAVVLAAVVLHTGGAWYFSDQLRADALVVAPDQPSYDIVVAGFGEGTISLRSVEGDGDILTDPGVMGLDWRTGYGQLGEPATPEPDGSITRPLRVLEGDLPTVGRLTAADAYAYPGDPGRAFDLVFDEVAYDTPLGPMGAWRLRGIEETWVIHLHGKGSGRGEALRLVGPVAASGYPQLVVSYRNDPGQPADPSGFYQYGATEWEDVAAAVEFAVTGGADRVVLVGYSTGAALALAYLLRVEDAPIAGLVFDSPNIDFGATVDYGASQRTLPVVSLPIPPTLVWAAEQTAALRFGIDWGALDYIARADELEVPVLVIHGTADTTVPLETSQRFGVARPDLVTLVQVPDAEHVRSWNVDPSSYERRVLEFLGRF